MSSWLFRRRDSKSNRHRGLALFAIALGVGIAVLSNPSARSWAAEQWDSASKKGASLVATLPEPMRESVTELVTAPSAITTTHGSSRSDRGSTTYAANNQVLIAPAYREDGEFIGYRVAGRTGDYRFSNGAVVTTINGTPVEDSAAGSELLLIAISQTDTKLGMLNE